MTAHWIKVEKDTAAKPEVMRLAAILDIDEFTVVGHLIAFWSWVDSNLSPECPQTQGTKRGLDRIAGRTGFCDALISVGWLTFDGDLFGIPNMGRHMGQSAKLRAMDKEKKAKKRSKTASVPEVSLECPSESGTNQGQKQDKSGTREEKRREEIKDTHAGAAYGEQGQVFIPDKMNTPECLRAFERWCDWCESQGLDAINPRYNAIQAEAVWSQANRIGPEKWPLCVEHSIANGYKSIIQRTEPAGGRQGKLAEDIDPDFLRAVEVCREFPSASDYDREQREAKLGPDVMRLVRKITSARLAECNDFSRKALAAEWTINRSAMR